MLLRLIPYTNSNACFRDTSYSQDRDESIRQIAFARNGGRNHPPDVYQSGTCAIPESDPEPGVRCVPGRGDLIVERRAGHHHRVPVAPGPAALENVRNVLPGHDVRVVISITDSDPEAEKYTRGYKTLGKFTVPFDQSVRDVVEAAEPLTRPASLKWFTTRDRTNRHGRVGKSGSGWYSMCRMNV